MRRFSLGFKPHDYLLPLPSQIRQLNTMRNLEDMLNYPKSVLQLVKVDSSLIPKENLQLRRALALSVELPYELTGPVCKELIKSEEHKEVIKPIMLSKIDTMADEELATYCIIFQEDIQTPMKNTIISSFEDLWYIIEWKKNLKLPHDNLKFLLEQSQKLYFEDKIDLDSICNIYETVCRAIILYDALWPFYNDLITKYFYALLPHHICQIAQSFISVKTRYIQDFSWLINLQTLEYSFISDFSPAQLAKLSKMMLSLNLKLPSCIKPQLLSQPHYSSDYLYCVFSLNLKKPQLSVIISKILESSCIKEHTKALKTLLKFGSLKFVEEVIKKIEANISSANLDEIIELIDASGEHEQTINLLTQTMPRLELLLPDASIQKLERIADLIGIFIHQEIQIPYSFFEKYLACIESNLQDVSHRNFHTFSHLFSYLMPLRKGHDLLDKLIYSSRLSDYKSNEKPSHGYFEEINPNEYRVLNHPILSHMRFVDLAVAISCLKMKFQLSKVTDEIVNSYLKIIIKRFYFKLNGKHRSKLGIVLAMPENFNKELADLFFNQLQKSYDYKHRSIYTYTTAVTIKNFKNIGYHHELMEKIQDEDFNSEIG